MSFGFPPNYTQTFSYPGATKFLLHKVTLSTFQEMDWSIIDKSQSLVTARSPFSLFSWGETISVKLDKNSITVASSSRGLQIYDFGKNKSNVSDFGTTFERLAKDASIDVPRQSLRPVRTLESIGEEYTPDDLSIENTETSPSFNSLFIPRKNYFVTPIIAIINILVFAVMVITGAGIVSPKIEIILSWGANFRPLTLQGEWWRLFTSCFVHIGIEHLLMNLYALLFIGLLLEPIMGSVRFSFAYILAGLTGSIASLYWHEITVSAGASGAIFGLYGVFLSLLTTKYIEEKKRKSLLLSIIIFVVYNLVFGLKGNIDNAAHIGGLLGGLFIGYCYYFSLKKPKDKRLNAATISLSVIVLVSTSFFVFANTSNDLGIYQKNIEAFGSLEYQAIQAMQFSNEVSNDSALVIIKEHGIRKWQEAIVILGESEKLQLPDVYHKRNQLFKKYCEIRIQSYEFLCEVIEGKADINSIEGQMINSQLMQVVDEIKGTAEEKR